MNEAHKALLARLIQLSGCQTVRSEPIWSGGFRVWTEGGEMRASGYGDTPHEAACNALEVAGKIAITVAESKHAAEIERIKRLACMAPEDPRDARIRELERSLAEQKEITAMVEAQMKRQIQAVADALGLS